MKEEKNVDIINEKDSMKSLSGIKQINRTVPILLLLVLVVVFLVNACAIDNQAEYRMKHPSAFKKYIMIYAIAPDNDTLLFTYTSVFESKLATYKMSTREIKMLEIPSITHCTVPKYSRDGKKIIFRGSSDSWQGEKSFSGQNINIYIMNADGTGLRQITHLPPNKIKADEVGPVKAIGAVSLSPDGDRIIYFMAARQRKKAPPLTGTMLSWWDIYEIDIATGIERQLTNYQFYEMTSKSCYLADGRHFIFSADLPFNTKGTEFRDGLAYAAKYKGSSIYIMDGKNNMLKPAFTHGNNSQFRDVSRNDDILFLSRTNEMDNKPKSPEVFDLFIRKKDGKIRRVTNLNSHILWAIISPDGSQILFLKKDDLVKWLIKSDGTGLRELVIPIEKLGMPGSK